MDDNYIVQDSAEYDNIGFDDCNFDTNGEYKLLQNIIKDNFVIFDVGANVGDWTNKLLSINNKPNSINCFEPVKQTFDRLKLNVVNDKVKFNNYAVCDSCGKKIFNFYGPTLQFSELSTLYRRAPHIEKMINMQPKEVIVKSITLDKFCKINNINHIDFLKIDTEGAELDVIVGASEILRKKIVKIIQFEYGGCYLDSKITLKQIFNILSVNYLIYRILPEHLLEINQWNDKYENYLYSNYIAILKE